MQIEAEKIRNILVLRNDRFGEFLLNIPSLRALKETFKQANIIAVIKPANRQLAEAITYIDEILEWDNKKHTFSDVLNLIKLLRKKRIDLAVMLNPSKEFNLITFFSGIPLRLGYDKKLSFLLTHKMVDSKHLGAKHEIEYNLDLVSLVGVKTRNKSLSLNFPEADLSKLGINEGKGYIVIHPWTSDPVKNWPEENFKKLALEIIEKLNVRVVVIGGKDELAKRALLFGSGSEKLINLTGATNFRQLSAVLKHAYFLISCDSGPVHLAGCLGLPVLAIFRDDLPGKTASRWGPVSTGSRVIKTSFLSSVTVGEVLLSAQQMLENRRNNN
jgi:ADP-heptose:LPS heptosyltransferase